MEMPSGTEDFLLFTPFKSDLTVLIEPKNSSGHPYKGPRCTTSDGTGGVMEELKHWLKMC